MSENTEGNSKAGAAGITYWPASGALRILELVQDHNIWLKNQTERFNINMIDILVNSESCSNNVL